MLGAASAGLLSAQPLTRVAATSLRLTATPPAATYSLTRAFTNLTFVQPVALVTPPGDPRRLFVVEKPGRIWLIPDVTAASPTRTLFLDLTDRVLVSTDSSDERGLLAPGVDYETPPPYLHAIGDPMDAEGYVHLSQEPGMGYQINWDYIEENRVS